MAFLALILIILIPLAKPKQHYLVISAVDDGEVVFRARVEAGTRFSTTFKHSVQLSDWTDFYEITEDFEFRLYETRFSDFGWGFPSEPDPGADMEVTDTYVRYFNMNRVLASFKVSVTTATDTHLLEFGATEVDLIEKAGPGRLLEFRIDG